MSYDRLIEFVDGELATNRSLVIDSTMFERLTGEPITRERAHRAAWLLTKRRNCLASAEAFLNAETREVARVYMICARTRRDYAERAKQLQPQVVAELSGDITQHVLYQHDYRDPTPAPLREPPRK